MIILVTGLMRSGTSLIARQLHELGIPMGSKMRFPLMRDNSQLDWEDVDFTDNCLSALIGKIDTRQLERFFYYYIGTRKKKDLDPWGVKSPFVLPYINLFKDCAKDTVKIVLTERDVDQTFKSIRRQTILEGPEEIQKLLLPFRDPDADLIVKIEESWKTPELVKNKLIELIRS